MIRWVFSVLHLKQFYIPNGFYVNYFLNLMNKAVFCRELVQFYIDIPVCKTDYGAKLKTPY